MFVPFGELINGLRKIREDKKVERCYLDRESVLHRGVEDEDKRVVRWIRFGLSWESLRLIYGFLLPPVITILCNSLSVFSRRKFYIYKLF